LRTINPQPPAVQGTAGVGWVAPSPMRRLDLPRVGALCLFVYKFWPGHWEG